MRDQSRVERLELVEFVEDVLLSGTVELSAEVVLLVGSASVALAETVLFALTVVLSTEDVVLASGTAVPERSGAELVFVGTGLLLAEHAAGASTRLFERMSTKDLYIQLDNLPLKNEATIDTG